ncbi:Protein CREG1 [Choanephora cucurbitarum]|uniref:Protein CREG1 n=1 Tax=Choanephora cucurbitarum TaxID=101091 RepID=A0A1C7N6X7_9FUNG|nr:Protein CREG1 [Choanephora cucurbitarum]
MAIHSFLFCLFFAFHFVECMMLQSVETAAQLARRVVSDAGRGHIVTLMDASVSSDLSGYPFAIMEYYSDECTKDTGNLLLFMSDLQLSARNMHHNANQMSFTITALKDYNRFYGNQSTPVQQPRFTLFGHVSRVPDSQSETAFECFIKTHPEAKPWNHFHDFRFYEFHVEKIYYVGGFGGLNYIGWIPIELYRKAHLHRQTI